MTKEKGLGSSTAFSGRKSDDNFLGELRRKLGENIGNMMQLKNRYGQDGDKISSQAIYRKVEEDSIRLKELQDLDENFNSSWDRFSRLMKSEQTVTITKVGFGDKIQVENVRKVTGSVALEFSWDKGNSSIEIEKQYVEDIIFEGESVTVKSFVGPYVMITL